jgi:mannitol/fructose-specific phosphotransferase system IIA component (Ntr-type)
MFDFPNKHIILTNEIISDADDSLRKLLRRERMVSTAMGDGVAIPYARNPAENASGESLICIGICRAGTGFESLDGKTTHLFFPVHTDNETVDLRITAKLTALLKNDDVTRSILDSKSTENIISILMREEQKDLLLSRF